MLSNALVLLAAAAGLVSAIPTSTGTQHPSRTNQERPETHTVAVGRGGLRYEPDNIFAPVGSVVEFHFLPANHSVIRSSFEEPCAPLSGDSFVSGFFPTKEGQNPEVFQIVVEDEKPIWFYCGQGSHCQSEMVGVVNQDPDSAKNLRAFRALAAAAPPTVVPPGVRGGKRIPNPNPLAGV